MFFIFLLAVSTIAIAGSAAYFSVYGLANTFSGVFWSVVVMGASLEAGKLIGASYLYRYWKTTTFLLKSYMMAAVLALMLLTSGGIFGYLSSGYQADVLPLRQIEAQIVLLEEEKVRMLERKKGIDLQISQLPPNYVTARIRLMREFQAEQKIVTDRIKALDAEVLELKTRQIKTEAHIGPITYIAKAFDIQTDDATKWLVFLIIFAFDPMAVALTLAINIALRRRDEELAGEKLEKAKLIAANAAKQPEPEVRIVDRPVEVIKEVIKEVPVEKIRTVEVPVEKIVYRDREVPVTVSVPAAPTVETPAAEPESEPEPEPEPVGVPQRSKPASPPVRHDTYVRRYSPRWTEGTGTQEKIEKLLEHYRFLTEKQRSGATLKNDELVELQGIKEILKKKGYDSYLDE